MMKRLFPIAFVAAAVTISACDSSEPDDDGAGEGELITRVVLTLTTGGKTATATASDPDGDGTDFSIDTLSLDAGFTYSGTVDVFDDVNDEDVGREIENEQEEHQFFFTPGGGVASRLVVTATDEDANGLPVGLEFEVVDSGSGSADGTLRVILSHFDETPKNGTDRSDETDIDITFPVVIR